DRIDPARAALIVYDACRRALTPVDPARRATMRPVLDAWVTLIGACRARAMPIIYTTPVSRADGADVVLLPTDLSVQTGVPSHTHDAVPTSPMEALELLRSRIRIRQPARGHARRRDAPRLHQERGGRRCRTLRAGRAAFRIGCAGSHVSAAAARDEPGRGPDRL